MANPIFWGSIKFLDHRWPKRGGGVHLGKKIFRGAHTRPQNAPKIPLKPPKMAILRPNLNDGVLPRDNGEVLL